MKKNTHGRKKKIHAPLDYQKALLMNVLLSSLSLSMNVGKMDVSKKISS